MWTRLNLRFRGTCASMPRTHLLALDFGYIRPASYRLPAGYPSSVQPIRARPYPTGGDSRFIPGSTLPTHIVPSGISRTNAADSGSQCHLQNWYLVLDTVKGHVSVHGNSVNSEGVYVVRRSSAILQTLSDRSLVTAKGSCYKLVGPANGVKELDLADNKVGAERTFSGNTDESEEPSVGKPSVTPKRRVRVPGQASARKVISDSSDGESQLETPLTKHSEAESQNQQELKTPRSGIKWKTGRRYFRYKEPETNSSSITRSGRKVRKPQDWWANAQDHLAGSGNSHKECNIKYKWGSGDAMVVKGGKRMRLSDFYLQGGDEIALFNEEAPDTNEVDDGLEEQKSE
ncbi:hypothetical protein J3B02_003445 [Coemansia erecta]|nr:hypothetical protein J3B02_003445 [Coemansia erecta]